MKEDQNIHLINAHSGVRFYQYLNPGHLVSRLLTYRELLLSFIWWEFRDRYRGSALGAAWAVLVPLMRISVFTLVFSMLLGGKKAVWNLDSDLAVGKMIFCGFVLFNVFAESIGKSPRLMWSNKTYVKNILFPLEIIPLTINGAAVIQSFIGMGVLILLELFTQGSLPWTICFLPLLYIPLIFFVSGISWILAALGVFNRDINNLIQSIIQLFFLLSAVLFPLERLVRFVPDQMEWILRLNLLATIVDESRRVVIQGHPPDWFWLAYTFLAAFLFMIIGYACFMHFRKEFADVV